MAVSPVVLDRLAATYQSALIRLTSSADAFAGAAWDAGAPAASATAVRTASTQAAQLTASFVDSYVQLAGGPAVPDPVDIDAVMARVRGGANLADLLRAAEDRADAGQIADQDVMLAAGESNAAASARHGISRFRRRPNPGACSFCILAAQQLYRAADLRPLHTKCHCVTVPAVL